MSTTQLWLLVAVLLAILLVLGLPWLLAQRRRREPWSAETEYLAAIDALIRDDRRAAADHLREVARAQSDNVLAYLRLGDLIRSMGDPERAQKIHAGLTARPIDSPDLQRRIEESLLLDVLAQKRWEEVVRMGEKLRGQWKKSRPALLALTTAYAELGRWDAAFAAADEWERLHPGSAEPRPHVLRIRAAEQSVATDDPGRARQLLESAHKLGAPAQDVDVLLGDVLALEGHHEAAAEKWLEFARAVPDRASEVFDRLERSYYEMGKFGDLLEVYESLSHGSDASAAQIALADMHVRRGRTEEAIHLLESILANDSANTEAFLLLVQCHLEEGRVEHAARVMKDMLESQNRVRLGGRAG